VSDYHINLFYSESDEGYIADIPDLDSCSAFGETPQEALAEVLRARDAWLAVARETGRAVPSPRYRPAIYAG
jgi:predicted RNase H-like HicB family nuclease